MNLLSRAFKAPPPSIDAIERESMWRATMKYRIGKRFLALDTAGNPVLYHAYKRKTPLGWAPITITDMHTLDPTKPGGFALLVERHPLHHKCLPLVEKHLQMLREKQAVADKEWTEVLKKRYEAILEEFAEEESSGPATSTSGSPDTADTSNTPKVAPSSAAMPAQPSPINFRYEMNKILYKPKICRLNRFVTYGYKTLYYSIVAAAVFVVICLYRGFKAWLNPPARRGLTNIENSILFYPRRLLSWLEDTIYFPLLELLDDLADDEDSTRPASVVASAIRNMLRPILTYLRELYGSLSGMTALAAAERENSDRIANAKQRTELAKRQSNRLREMFAFLFILFFVLLIL